MKIGKAYLKEHLGQILLYVGIVGIFLIVPFLYNMRLDAIRYMLLLSVVFLAAYWGTDFVRFRSRHLKLKEAEHTIISDLSRLPEASSMIEKDYQQMLEILWQAKSELESENIIARQDMLDYYSMWVHQIKTPISAMHILLQTKEQEAEKQEDRRLAGELKLELFRIEQYVEMVLTYLRMEQMSGDLAFAEHDLDDIIRQAVRKYSKMFILKKMGLQYEPVNRKVLTDDKWLVFVLEQILSNALKYTKNGEITICMEKDELVIADTGIGIQKEDLPRVFEKGFTGYNGRSDKKSTGIGLYLCKTIMDKLKHRIRIESRVGEGTKVYLYLERERLKVE